MVLFYILGVTISSIWLFVFKYMGIGYYITFSLYAIIYFSLLGYVDYKRELKIKNSIYVKDYSKSYTVD